MVKPLEERTDDELQRVAAGELGDKKQLSLKKFFAAAKRPRLRS